MIATWFHIIQQHLSGLLNFLPRWALKRLYPIKKRIDNVAIWGDSRGVVIYLNPERAPAISGLNILVFNRLPFPISLEMIQFQISLSNYAFLEKKEQLTKSIDRNAFEQIQCMEIDLDEGHVQQLKQKFAFDFPIVSFSGHVHCKSIAGDFDRRFSFSCLALSYRAKETV